MLWLDCGFYSWIATYNALQLPWIDYCDKYCKTPLSSLNRFLAGSATSWSFFGFWMYGYRDVVRSL
ncbi:hypothetical protein AB0756_39835, partial [Tolypothrix campylonemoides VB511288_2]